MDYSNANIKCTVGNNEIDTTLYYNHNLCIRSVGDIEDLANIENVNSGDMIYVTSTNSLMMYDIISNNKWIKIMDDSNKNDHPKKIVYDILKVEGFNCPGCGSTEYEEVENSENKIRCKHCRNIYRYKLE